MPSNTPSPYSSPWSHTEIAASAGSTISPSRQIFRERISSRAAFGIGAPGRSGNPGAWQAHRTCDRRRCGGARSAPVRAARRHRHRAGPGVGARAGGGGGARGAGAGSLRVMATKVGADWPSDAGLPGRRDRFLLELTDAIRSVADARAVMRVIAERLGAALSADGVGYGEIDESRAFLTIAEYWCGPEVTSLLGRH